MRALAVIFALLAVALNPATATAAQRPLEYHVYGTATVGGFWSYTDTFDVQGNAFAASGYYERFQPSTGTFIRAQVDCLNVEGDAAYMSGVFTETRNANVFAGERFYVSVEDNGESGVGDLVGTIRAGDPTTCMPIPNGGTPIVAGDVVIEVVCDNFKDKRHGQDKCKDKD